MNTNAVPWIGWCAAALFVASRSLGAGETWRVIEQPGLNSALERAPVLSTESLGEPARGVLTFTYALVPNPDGKTWDFLQWYFKEYRGPTWLHAIDLGTGQVKKHRCADDRQFYLSGRALAFDGKYYMVQPGPAGRDSPYGMFLEVYDPATNELEDRGEIVPGLSGEVRPIVLGPDGRLYGTGSYDDGRVGLYIYDPKLQKVVKNFGGVGPRHANGAWSRYEMGVDDTHAYIASGMIPWYLVAVNLETGEEKVLLESPPGHLLEIANRFPGAWAIVPGGDGAPQKEYWLYHGEAIPKVNDTPPWPPRTSPWDKAPPKPEIYRDQLDPDAGGNATFWYRLPDDAAKAPKDPPADAKAEDLGWRAIRLEGVDSYSHRIAPLAVLPDGRLYGEGDSYCGSFLFDPRTDGTIPLGRNQGLASYARIVLGDRLYLSGYPGGPLFAYDPARPWTLHKGGPPGRPALDAEDPASNPRRLGSFEGITRVAIAHRAAIGSDGRIYFGGFGERGYTGGGLGWYDPKTGKLDGFWRPLSGYGVHWMAPLAGGRRIALSTVTAQDELNGKRVPEEAKLFVYDVEQARIAREIVPVPKAPGTGPILDVAPDRLLGLTVDPEHPDSSLLYGVDVTTGDVMFRKALPRPVSGDDRWYGHWLDPSYEHLDLVRGPDGFAWTYLKDILVRIDPKDAGVHVVGKIDPLGRPTFVGRDMYLSGPERLRRIRDIVPPRAPEAPSPVIERIDWLWETHRKAAPGSDLWPVTWAADGHLYAAWGDGGGFGGTDSDGRVAMGIARIEGPPESPVGRNVNGGKDPENSASFAAKGKTGGILAIGRALYAWLNLENGEWPDVDRGLAWSRDLGATWQKSSWVFPKGPGRFKPGTFLNFGRGYTGLPAHLEGYVYFYGDRQGLDAGAFMGRVPIEAVTDRGSYEFLAGFDAARRPIWGADVDAVHPVFSGTTGSLTTVSHHPKLKRFLLAGFHAGPGQLGIFDGPEPWGPWTTVAYYEEWGKMGREGEGLTCSFPPKWMSDDGLSLWCIFSVYGAGARQGIEAHDRFNLVKAVLTLRDREPR